MSEDIAKMTGRAGWVYTLRLRDNCWYVGFSADPETRIASHFLGRGARWTQLHPPLAVESLQPGDEKLEDVVTIALMAQRGFQLVRGGRYVAVDMPLPPPPIIKAYSINPPPPVPAETEAEAIGGHSVLVTQLRDEGETAWRARVAGEKAAKSCPARGYKTLYAPDEVQLKERVHQWLEGA
jgi:hypothetical protein